jgi:hypothetical protein
MIPERLVLHVGDLGGSLADRDRIGDPVPAAERWPRRRRTARPDRKQTASSRPSPPRGQRQLLWQILSWPTCMAA